MKRLVLFDIDGTLLHGGALWRECFEGAFKSLYPGLALNRVSFNGKTDPLICHELLNQVPPRGGPPHSVMDPARPVIDEYLRRVEASLLHRNNEVEALPGAYELLERLMTHPEARLGLLTGNVARGARIKLSAVAMDRFFSFGVYGDDHWDRYELPRLAVDRAWSEFNVRYSGKEIVVVGDTVHDVNCGKSIGVRSIAVGTGRNVDRAELLAAQPDFFFEDLTSVDEVIRAILAP